MDILVAAVLAAALVTATITDIRSQRIPNWLTFPLMLGGLAAHALHTGLDGLLFSLAGFGLGLGVMLVPFLLGLMGAGDVKLMAAVGAWLGINTALMAFLITCMAGGVYALAVLLRNMEMFRAVLENIKAHFITSLLTRKLDYTPVVSERTLPRLCYGVAIAFGTVASMVLTYHETGGFFVR
ncbi:A24 family peptidase [Salidesulfovibrio onnuriiensis]|uniref:A24 family peptidase n=1 Tax=Salidesulfovibrio onnuriiensis TaxID=2583823 RepID=UPI0011C8566C|nr:A24 family peptidase [Salidesulfovibrio onnuriiensis]